MKYRDFFTYLIENNKKGGSSPISEKQEAPLPKIPGVDENMTEEYPATWNKHEFETASSFAAKMRYAEAHLPKIASGSGRVVFKIDDQKVLKLAKNKKGIAQNEVEGDQYLQNYGIVAKVFDRGDHGFWIEMELAKKVTKKRFKELSGGFSVEEIGIYAKINKENVKWMSLDPIVREKMDNSEFVSDLMSVIYDYDMSAGDLGRTSTWGEVLRDGKPAVVLIDYGLTTQVYDDWYKINQ